MESGVTILVDYFHHIGDRKRVAGETRRMVQVEERIDLLQIIAFHIAFVDLIVKATVDPGIPGDGPSKLQAHKRQPLLVTV